MTKTPTAVLEWSEPPAPKVREHRPRVSKYRAMFNEMEAEPGRWAKLAVGKNAQGVYLAIKREYGPKEVWKQQFEIRSKTMEDGLVHVWGRCISGIIQETADEPDGEVPITSNEHAVVRNSEAAEAAAAALLGAMERSIMEEHGVAPVPVPGASDVPADDPGW